MPNSLDDVLTQLKLALVEIKWTLLPDWREEEEFWDREVTSDGIREDIEKRLKQSRDCGVLSVEVHVF